MRRWFVLLSLLLLAATWLAGCSDGAPPAADAPADSPLASSTPVDFTPAPNPSPVPSPAASRKLGTSAGLPTTARAPDFVGITGAKASFGALGQAVYRIEVPEKWNGELVLWAHGYRGNGSEVTVENPPEALRRLLIDQGYAWAASSYSENGYTPGVGADDTLALKRHFVATVGAPTRTYIAGASMGGNVVALSLENFPGEYDGALAICGALGGEEIIDYLVSWNRLAEFISGVKLPVGPGASASAVGAALGQIALAFGPPESPTEKGGQFASAIRMLTGGPRPFFVEGFRQQYVVNFGLLALDPELKSLAVRAATNEGVDYAIEPGLGLTGAQINAGVVRQKADPEARNAANHPDAVPTTGKLSAPLLTLHNTGDLFVPVSQEQSYRQKADAAGKGDLLVQRLIRDGGHCKFSAEEMTAAWNDLRVWVTDKRKPKGDDVLGDLSDAGRQFTDPIRPGDPGTK